MPQLCDCGEVVAKRTVRKEGPNCGREFLCCPRGQNQKQCGYFSWDVEKLNVGASLPAKIGSVELVPPPFHDLYFRVQGVPEPALRVKNVLEKATKLQQKDRWQFAMRDYAVVTRALVDLVEPVPEFAMRLVKLHSSGLREGISTAPVLHQGGQKQLTGFGGVPSVKITGTPAGSVVAAGAAAAASSPAAMKHSDGQISEKAAKELSARLPAAVLPYQREGFEFAIRRHGRVLFGDEMGLGKSLQALMTIDFYAEELPCLIICPSSLRFGWRDQVLKWLGKEGTGTIERLTAAGEEDANVNTLAPASGSATGAPVAAASSIMSPKPAEARGRGVYRSAASVKHASAHRSGSRRLVLEEDMRFSDDGGSEGGSCERQSAVAENANAVVAGLSNDAAAPGGDMAGPEAVPKKVARGRRGKSRRGKDDATAANLHSPSDSFVQVLLSGKDDLSPSARVVVVSFDLLRNPKFRRAHSNEPYKIVVVDESQFVKNEKSQRTKLVTEVCHLARRCLLLSGTPALNRAIELYTQLCCLFPSQMPAFSTFASRYSQREVKRVRGREVEQFTGVKNGSELHVVLEASCMIRRKKKDVLRELPPKLRSKLTLDPTRCDAEKLAAVRKHVANLFSPREGSSSSSSSANIKGNHGQGAMADHAEGDAALERVLLNPGVAATGEPSAPSVSQIFQLTAECKTEPVLDYVEYLLTEQPELKFLVFAHHKVMLDKLEERVRHYARQTGYIRIDGGTKQTERPLLVREFQENKACRAAILSITACGQGLTLTAASAVVFAELYWVPGVLQQAEDRAHRIGQEASMVNVYYLVCPGTLDERVYRLVEKKAKDCATILDGHKRGLQVYQKANQDSLLMRLIKARGGPRDEDAGVDGRGPDHLPGLGVATGGLGPSVVDPGAAGFGVRAGGGEEGGALVGGEGGGTASAVEQRKPGTAQKRKRESHSALFAALNADAPEPFFAAAKKRKQQLAKEDGGGAAAVPRKATDVDERAAPDGSNPSGTGSPARVRGDSPEVIVLPDSSQEPFSQEKKRGDRPAVRRSDVKELPKVDYATSSHRAEDFVSEQMARHSPTDHQEKAERRRSSRAFTPLSDGIPQAFSQDFVDAMECERRRSSVAGAVAGAYSSVVEVDEPATAAGTSAAVAGVSTTSTGCGGATMLGGERVQSSTAAGVESSANLEKPSLCASSSATSSVFPGADRNPAQTARAGAAPSFPNDASSFACGAGQFFSSNSRPQFVSQFARSTSQFNVKPSFGFGASTFATSGFGFGTGTAPGKFTPAFVGATSVNNFGGFPQKASGSSWPQAEAFGGSAGATGFAHGGKFDTALSRSFPVVSQVGSANVPVEQPSGLRHPSGAKQFALAGNSSSSSSSSSFQAAAVVAHNRSCKTPSSCTPVRIFSTRPQTVAATTISNSFAGPVPPHGGNVCQQTAAQLPTHSADQDAQPAAGQHATLATAANTPASHPFAARTFKTPPRSQFGAAINPAPGFGSGFGGFGFQPPSRGFGPVNNKR